MNLDTVWSYIEATARARLKHNQTPHHVSEYGEEIEVLGAAGEMAALLYFGLPPTLGVHFDGGCDLVYNGIRIDVKATHWTKLIEYRYLQWPPRKNLKADAVLMTAVNLGRRAAKILGYATPQMILNSPINPKRKYPCHEISVQKLRPAHELKTCQAVSQDWSYREGRHYAAGA